MCRVLEVSRSGYYGFKNRRQSQRKIDNAKLLLEIERVYYEHRKNYGSPRIWDQLHNKEQLRCSENRVARIMRENGIAAVGKRKFRVTTNSKHHHPVWDNILNRQFTVNQPNVIWVSDITYVWTLEGWLYVAVVIDLFSRKIVGLAMGKTITAELIQRAINQAILRRNPSNGLIFHSDRGSQYASNDFKEILAKNKFVGSMSKKGDCWDNAVAESFFHTLKVELIHRNKFTNRKEAKQMIFEYIEMYYNRKRSHSTLGYLSPAEYERRQVSCLN